MHESSIAGCVERQNMLIKLRQLIVSVKKGLESEPDNTDDLIFALDQSGRNLIDVMLEPVTSDAKKEFNQSVKLQYAAKDKPL